MSTALIRGNMLTQLANRGESASEPIEQLVRKFLTSLPGPWLPEEFFAPYELIERSIRDASDGGRHSLLRALHQLINDLFEEVKARQLDESESRQLFGALSIVAEHPLIKGSQYPRLLDFAIKQSALFSSRVTAPPDIVSNPQKFLVSRFNRLTKTERYGPNAGLRAMLRHAYRAAQIRHKYKSSAFQRAFVSGEPVEVEMRLNGVSRKSGLLRINNRDTIMLGFNELDAYYKRRDYPVVHIGEVILNQTSERSIANATNARVDDMVAETDW